MAVPPGAGLKIRNSEIPKLRNSDMVTNYGWADGARVPVAAPELEAEEPAAAAAAGGWWPSRSARMLWLDSLSAAEAGAVSREARRALMLWLAGDGLHPVRWMRRWAEAMRSLTPDLLPDHVRAQGLSSVGFERAVLGALFPRGAYARERRRLDGVWLGLGKKVWRGDAATASGERLGDLLSGARALEWAGSGRGEEDAGEEAATVARLAMVSLARWIGHDGGWCLAAVKRYYVLVWYAYRELAPGMTGDDFGKIYGQTRAAFSADAQRLMGRRLEWETGRAVQAPGQKAPESRAAYAANAARHCPRRQLDGAAGWEGRPDADAEAAAAARMAQARLRELRAEAQRRELERDAEALRVMAERTRGQDRSPEA